MAATTSSIGMLANELRPMAVPRAAAARATATSPSGCTAWTPVGRDEDRERDLLAHDLGGQVPAVGQAGHVRGEAELGEGGDVVLDA